MRRPLGERAQERPRGVACAHPPSPRSLSTLLRHTRWRACGRPLAALWRLLEACSGAEEAGAGPWQLPCLSLAGAPATTAPLPKSSQVSSPATHVDRPPTDAWAVTNKDGVMESQEPYPDPGVSSSPQFTNITIFVSSFFYACSQHETNMKAT